MACRNLCTTDRQPSEKLECATACSKVERMVHNILRPSSASVGLIDAQTNMLASLGSSAMPRL
ncbi:MAG: hypothetical protein GC202_03090 [Alphaproteobacteria bacterium]|nr:hypothetical protein [Alphaproteobacteria bacterium]